MSIHQNITCTQKNTLQSIFLNRKVITGNYAVSDGFSDHAGPYAFIACQHAAPIAITLPNAATWPGQKFTIVDESGTAATNIITVTAELSQTINSQSSFVIDSAYDSVSFYSNGAAWHIG